MLCSELMKPALTCREDDPVVKAAGLMRDRGIGFVPIVDGQGRALGVLTDRDLALRVVAEGRDAGVPCGSVMTLEPIVCRAGETLHHAERLLMEARKWRLVVTDEAGRCVGVVSLSDIAQAEGRYRTGKVLQDVIQREAPPVVEEFPALVPP
jgi:CBS domain-containing protein